MKIKGKKSLINKNCSRAGILTDKPGVWRARDIVLRWSSFLWILMRTLGPQLDFCTGSRHVGSSKATPCLYNKGSVSSGHTLDVSAKVITKSLTNPPALQDREHTYNPGLTTSDDIVMSLSGDCHSFSWNTRGDCVCWLSTPYVLVYWLWWCHFSKYPDFTQLTGLLCY